MSELGDLYQEVILDHNRAPRNFRRLEGATRKAEGYNPLCGDQITLYLKLEGDVIREISFQGSGCAICKASASMMTDSVKQKTKAEAGVLSERFRRLVTTGNSDEGSLGKLAVFSGVSAYPVRVKCATLAWHALKAALEAKKEIVSTE